MSVVENISPSDRRARLIPPATRTYPHGEIAQRWIWRPTATTATSSPRTFQLTNHQASHATSRRTRSSGGSSNSSSSTGDAKVRARGHHDDGPRHIATATSRGRLRLPVESALLDVLRPRGCDVGRCWAEPRALLEPAYCPSSTCPTRASVARDASRTNARRSSGSRRLARQARGLDHRLVHLRWREAHVG